MRSNVAGSAATRLPSPVPSSGGLHGVYHPHDERRASTLLRQTKTLSHSAFRQRSLTELSRLQRRAQRSDLRPPAGVFDKAGINENVKGARNSVPQTHSLTISPSVIPHEPIADLKDFDASGSPPGLFDWRSPGSENRHDRC
jgi:hypothetical protein